MPLKTNGSLMPLWQRFIKRLVDIVVSLAGVILLSPLIIYVAIRTKLSSAGPVVYSQERVGYKGKKFRIRKFRSMYVNAEIDGPQLSTANDARITSWVAQCVTGNSTNCPNYGTFW